MSRLRGRPPIVYNHDWMAFNRPIPESSRPRSSPASMRPLVEAEKLMQIAFLLPSAVLVGWGLGALAQNHWHQKWMLAAGLILGCAAGLVSVIRVAFAAERAIGKSDNANSGNNQGNGSPQ